MDAPTEPTRRLVQNEKAFRRLNLKMEELGRTMRMAEPRGGPAAQFFCECSDPACRQRLPVGVDEYAEVHRHPDRYSIVPGHEVPEIEVVVDRRDGYLVVEKVVAQDA